MRSSSDWVQNPSGKWTFAPVQATRGLNKNSNMLLKSVFKGAATTILMQHRESQLFKDYERMLASGIKPNLAKLTLARKVASIMLALWKRKEVYSEKTNQTLPT
jgi:transposase